MKLVDADIAIKMISDEMITDTKALNIFRDLGDIDKVETLNMACERHIHIMEQLPAIDAVPREWHDKCMEIEIKKRMDLEKHGHWIEVQRIHEKDHTAICECSLCGDTVWVYDGQRAWNYCPNCGAYMGAEDETD